MIIPWLLSMYGGVAYNGIIVGLCIITFICMHSKNEGGRNLGFYLGCAKEFVGNIFYNPWFSWGGSNKLWIDWTNILPCLELSILC